MHSTEGLSVIFIKMKTEGNFCMITMLIFYILQLSKFMKDAYSLKVSYRTISWPPSEWCCDCYDL